jgi:hypothetical protein
MRWCGIYNTNLAPQSNRHRAAARPKESDSSATMADTTRKGIRQPGTGFSITAS